MPIKRYLNKIIVVLGALVTLLVATFAGCKEEPLTVLEEVTAALVSAESWSKPVVTVDGVDVSDVYRNFTISFKDGTYLTTGKTPGWAPSGKWIFGDEVGKKIILDDTVDIDIITLTATKLEFERRWEFETFEPGRVSSVKGRNKFSLTNQ